MGSIRGGVMKKKSSGGGLRRFVKSVKAKAKAAKRTGPSRRTQAQRDAINKRAKNWKRPSAAKLADQRDARAEKQAKRTERKLKALAPAKPKLLPIGPALAPLVTASRTEAERLHAATA